MSDDAEMLRWWRKLGEDAREAWCQVADGHGKITDAMVASIDEAEGDAGIWFTTPGAGWIDKPQAAVRERSMSTTLAEFVRRQCGA